MTTTIYRSTDASAPALSGNAAGGLIALLDACLVNGYGAKAAAGWTKAFSGTNLAAYRTAAGSMSYLRVDDTGPGAGSYREARVVGYETMTDVNTGTGPFPTAAQYTNGLFLRKSTDTSATARAWILAATNKTFHLFVFTGDTTNIAYQFSFGDIYSYKGSDTHACHIVGRTTENSSSYNYDTMQVLTSTIATTTAGHYISRSYTGIGGSTVVGQHANSCLASQTQVGYGGMTYPNPVDGGLAMTPLYLHEANVERGTIPGLWNVLHNQPFGLGDTVAGVGGLSGRTFENVLMCSSGQILFETSNTWTEN